MCSRYIRYFANTPQGVMLLLVAAAITAVAGVAVPVLLDSGALLDDPWIFTNTVFWRS